MGITAASIQSFFRPVMLRLTDRPDPTPAKEKAAEPGPLTLNSARFPAAVLLHVEKSVRGHVGNALKVQFDRILKHIREFEGAGVPTDLEGLIEFYNVENTAQRIASFVSGGFGGTSFGETDDAESRGAP